MDAVSPAESIELEESDPLQGLRVLVVEDEALVAMLVEDMLSDFGCEVIGPAGSIRQALDAIASDPPDAAILDVNLGGEPVYPVADALRRCHAPFVLATGYGEMGVAEGYRDAPVLQKPFEESELRSRLRFCVSSRKD